LNHVQAACDDDFRFWYVHVAAPGKTNDTRAFRRWCIRFRQWLEALPSQYYIGAGNAYLRIRIEMTFGHMTTKFQIMRNKMTLVVLLLKARRSFKL
jgi:hypothetical protein